jgi:hypothetical protein
MTLMSSEPFMVPPNAQTVGLVKPTLLKQAEKSCLM